MDILHNEGLLGVLYLLLGWSSIMWGSFQLVKTKAWPYEWICLAGMSFLLLGNMNVGSYLYDNSPSFHTFYHQNHILVSVLAFIAISALVAYSQRYVATLSGQKRCGLLLCMFSSMSFFLIWLFLFLLTKNPAI